MRIAGLVLSLTFIVAVSTAQNLSRIDSLKGELKNSSGFSRYEVLEDLSWEYRFAQPDSTIYYASKAYELGVELGLRKGSAQPLNYMGVAYNYKGDRLSAYQHYQRALDVAREQDDTVQVAYTQNNLGRLFYDQGLLSKSYQYFVTTIQLFEQQRDTTGMAYAYQSLGNLYRTQHDFQKAEENFLKALKLRLPQKNPRDVQSAYTYLGRLYQETGDIKRSNDCLFKADSAANIIHDEINLAEIKTFIAGNFIRLGRLDDAEKIFNEGFTVINKINAIRLMPRANLILGEIKFKRGFYAEARTIFQRALLQAQQMKELASQMEAYRHLSLVAGMMRDSQEQLIYHNHYLTLKDSLNDLDVARQVERLQFELRIEQEEKKNELLKLEQARHTAIISQQRLENVILIAIVTFVTTLFFVQYRNAKKRRKISERLEEQYSKIHKQRLEIILQKEKLERHNHELSEINHEKDTLMNIVAHDLKSPLNRIKGLSELMELEGNLNPVQSKYLGLIRDSTNSGLDLIIDLLDVNSLEVNREPTYSSFNLSTFLHERMNSFKHYAAVKEIDLQLHESGIHDIFLDQDYLARILDNLISNAIKFSPRNSVVNIAAEMSGGFYAIKVKDQGPGFNLEDRKFIFQKFKKLSARPTAGESSNGLGLAIVKILVDRLSGVIDLQSSKEKGSEFIVRFPVRNKIMA